MQANPLHRSLAKSHWMMPMSLMFLFSIVYYSLAGDSPDSTTSHFVLPSLLRRGIKGVVKSLLHHHCLVPKQFLHPFFKGRSWRNTIVQGDYSLTCIWNRNMQE